MDRFRDAEDAALWAPAGGESTVRLVYVAGPFRGLTTWDIAENVRNAERVGLEVARAGCFPVIPHANTHLLHGQGEDAFWLEGTLELMRRCDAPLTWGLRPVEAAGD